MKLSDELKKELFRRTQDEILLKHAKSNGVRVAEARMETMDSLGMTAQEYSELFPSVESQNATYAELTDLFFGGSAEEHPKTLDDGNGERK